MNPSELECQRSKRKVSINKSGYNPERTIIELECILIIVDTNATYDERMNHILRMSEVKGQGHNRQKLK